MSFVTENFERHLNKAISDLTDTLVYKGQTVSGVFSDLTTSHTLEPGGVVIDDGSSFVCNESSFTTLPDSDELVTVNGKAFRIESLMKDRFGGLTITLKNEYKP